jgi:outer membrane receptor protein involved in Fe transport
MVLSRNKLAGAVVAVSSAMVAGQSFAAIEEVVVTATKRAASTQDIPVAVSAVTEAKLEQMGITNFEDYLLQLPGVTAGGSGPGQNTIYIRGVASTTPNLTTAGVAGLAPNVALYLDEQPLAQPGRNLDVYAADLNRVEVLSGPQGTLFGASSQAGTVRLITNKPDHTGQYGKVKFGVATTASGDPSNNVELMYNLPVSESVALRAVAYRDHKGGYIDNVHGTRDASESARFRAAGTVRANGVAVSSTREGFQAGADLSRVNFLSADNADLVEDNFNDSTYVGARLGLSIDLNPQWNLLLTGATQSVDADGVFFADPNLDDLQTQQYSDNVIEDNYDNLSWTLKGMLNDLEVVYTGAYTDRETTQRVDYSDYLFVGQYLPYYICDYFVTYPGGAPDGLPVGTCQAPNLWVDSATKTKVQTHELRVSGDINEGLNFTAGAFYSDLELAERNDFVYPGSVNVRTWNTEFYDEAWRGFAPNYPYPTGYNSDPGPFPAGVIFRNDVLRTDNQYGVFGEVTADLNDQWALTLGARYYNIEVDFEGSANSSFYNGGPTDMDSFGTDISDLYNGDGVFTDNNSTFNVYSTHPVYDIATYDGDNQFIYNALRAPDKAVAKGSIFKMTLNYRPSDDVLLYGTVSEGFRPGLLNRPGGKTNASGTFTVPFELDTDDVMNYELGWKTDLADGQLRLNGSLFYVQIDKLQTTIFDPSITNLFFSDNAADAEVMGLEADFIYQPDSVEGLTISGAFSTLDTEITRVITPTGDVRKGDSLAFAPRFQGNLQARYEWSLQGDLVAHVMPHLATSSASYSDIITINRDRIAGWTMLGLTAGVSSDDWTAEAYIDNLTDERAEMSRNFVNDVERVSYARPRTLGMRVTYNF